MFHRCQRLVQKISRKNTTIEEAKLTTNITCSLVRTLQDLSTNFRKGQSAYLRSKYLEIILSSIAIP